MKGGFGSSEPRKSVVDPPRSKSAGDIIKPGPGHYDINCEKIENKSFSMFGHSSFSSMSGRLGGNNYQAIPAPWDYNITQYSINYRVDKEWNTMMKKFQIKVFKSIKIILLYSEFFLQSEIHRF